MAIEPAPDIAMPIVIEHAGVVLSSVRLVTITFDGYALRDEVEAFGDAIVGSDWFKAVGAEYQLTEGSHVQKVRLAAPPATLSPAEIEDIVADLIDKELVPAPLARGNQLLYLVYVPASVGFADPGRNYHETGKSGTGVKFPFAVVRDDGSGLATTTVAAARQLINAATDPYKAPNDGYYTDPAMPDPWSLVSAEVADLCEAEDPVTSSGYALPRVYSNQGASAGAAPCLPAGLDDIWSDVSVKPSQMQRIRAGQAMTFKVTGWSPQELPWALVTRVAKRSDLGEDEMRPELSDRMINNRTSVSLTLHAPLDALPGATGGIVLSGKNVRPWAIGFVVQ